MMTQAVTHWQTTVFGALAAGFLAAANYNGHGGWQGYLAAVAVAAFGFFAKDANK